MDTLKAWDVAAADDAATKAADAAYADAEAYKVAYKAMTALCNTSGHTYFAISKAARLVAERADAASNSLNVAAKAAREAAREAAKATTTAGIIDSYRTAAAAYDAYKAVATYKAILKAAKDAAYDEAQVAQTANEAAEDGLASLEIRK
jgi:hypothetical protein